MILCNRGNYIAKARDLNEAMRFRDAFRERNWGNRDANVIKYLKRHVARNRSPSCASLVSSAVYIHATHRVEKSRFSPTVHHVALCHVALLPRPVCKLLCGTMQPTDKRSSLRGKRLKALITAGPLCQSQKLTAPGIIFVREPCFGLRERLFDIVVINLRCFPFCDTALLYTA